MKKITFLLLTVFYSLFGYCQSSPFPEDFDDVTPYPSGLPADWVIGDNGVGTTQSWRLINTPPPYVNGTQAMYINIDNIGINNTSIDYLRTPGFAVPANGQLRFQVHQNQTGNQGSIFEVRYSTTSATDFASYQLLQSWTEPQLNAVYSDFEEKVVDLMVPGVTVGQTMYIVFVRVNTQTAVTPTGDRFVVDDVNVLEKCFNPTNLDAEDIASTSAKLIWEHQDTPSNFQIELALATGPKTGLATHETGNADVFYNMTTGLVENEQYKYWLRAECSEGVFSEWVGPFYFNTIPFGTVCSDPINITTIPYETDANTGSFGNSIPGPQSAACGATPASTNFLSGNDVIYRLVVPTDAPADAKISITLTPNGTRSSIFVYDECSNIVGGPCLAGVANTNGTPRVITNFEVEPGEDYYIVISSNVTTPTVPFNLIIQYENCEKPTNLGFNTPTLTGGNFVWTEAGTATAWEIVFQEAGENVPAGSGTPVATAGGNLDVPEELQGVAAQYWVRSVCPVPGLFSAWSGPYLFNTLICPAADQCTYTIRMTDSANNGWNGARMQIRQNGVVLTNSTGETTFGGNYNSGAGPVDVTVALCNNTPFEIFWLTAGTQPQQCIVSVLNSFGQTVYTKPAGIGTPGVSVYTGVVNCVIPQCDIAPTNVTVAPITTIGGVINWDAPGTENMGYNIYLVPSGQPAPSNATDGASQAVHTYTGVNGPAGPFSFTIPATPTLLADTAYDVYVRVLCAPFHSPWSVVKTFTTLPTCPKPINLGIGAGTITTTSATLIWTEASLATEWEVLLLPSGPEGQAPTPPTATVDPTTPLYFTDLTTTTLALPTDTLSPATIYYYYVRAVCGGNDPSTWSGPFIFNTITCADSDKCQYKIILTDTGGNGWNGARMQVRQNGIVVLNNIGSNFNSGSGPITVNFNVCDAAPFDIFWSVAGTAPAEVGFSIQNPFTDIIYTYVPGTGSPLTMLYDDNIIGNCTPPTCPKPTNLQVVSTTQTSAFLSWTPGSTETAWEVYAIPTTTPIVPPDNTVGPVTTTGAPYYLASTNTSFEVPDDLIPGTSYTYYVRAICSSTDYSTWTILNPKIFYTKPVNDECTEATPVPVNPTRICADFVSGTTVGATASPQPGPCVGTEDDDVWYSFVATSSMHIITFSNVTGVSTDINHTLYVGDECGALTQLYCSNPNVSIANNLTVGTIYKIRVYTHGTSPSNGNNPVTASFDLCITTPPQITNDECATAIVAPVNDDIPCVVFTAGSITGATASPESSTCAGTEDDDVWFEFTANSPTQIITLANVVGSLDDDLNHSLYQGDECGNLTFKYCSTNNESMAENLTVGAVYKIRVWSASNTVQDITFDLCIGRILPPITASTTLYTNQQLVEDILIKSDCATVTNITFSTGNTASTNGIGYFNKAESGFPFQDGIVLTSGSALAVPGPNNTILSNGGLGGDADLSAILAAQTPPQTGTLFNATSLEFDFIALTTEVSFNFLFASEEYGTFQCGYSDAFAFILTNVTQGTPPINLAILPGGIPVSVVNIRNQMFNGNCGSANAQYFDKFYANVVGGVNPIGAPINFNGVTVPLVAYNGSMNPGDTYHIKMVIADYNDGSYDSAVFLEGGSFDIGNIQLPDDYLIADGTALCEGDDVYLDSQLDPTLYDIQWFVEGEGGVKILLPETGPILTVTETGTYIIEAAYANTDCITSDSIVVEYFIDEDAGTPQNLTLCNASGSGIFDLTSNATTILAPFAPGTHELVYFLTLEDAENNVLENAIDVADLEEFLGTNGQIIYVRVNYLGTSCFQIVNFTLIVQDLTPQFTLLGTKEICPEAATTITVSPINNNFDPALVTYSWTFEGGPLAATGASLTINGEAGYGDYTVTVNNSGCSSTQSFEIINANTTWFFDLAAPATLCPDETATLTATITNNPLGLPVTYTYTLANGTEVVSGSNSIVIDAPGTYSVMVDIQGCISGPETITVGESVANWQVSFTGEPYVICPSQSVTLSFTATNFDLNDPNATYTWTTPSGAEAQGLTFSANEVGIYTLEVDILGCISSFEVNVDENSTPMDVDFVQGCESNSYRLVANPSNGSFDPLTSSYSWSGPNTQSFEATADPNVIILRAAGVFTVTVTTADGCVVSESISVNNVSCMIQRGISPNNNGENDSFDLSMLNVKELNIFNRYGTEVYNYRNYVDQWIGQSNSGDELPDGTYFYVIHTQEGESITGWIYINR